MSVLDSPTDERSSLIRLLRPFETASIAPAWVGLWLGILYLILHAAFDAAFLVFGNFPPGTSPMWAGDQWWTDFVNAALIGYLPAAHAIARHGVVRDLSEMRAELRLDDAEFGALRDTATSLRGPIARGLISFGMVGGAWLAFADPTISRAVSQSAYDPLFVWALFRMMVMGWLLLRFAVYDFNTTRIYISLGRKTMKVDLLDMRPLGPLIRRGQRSALVWVLYSTIFSLFWLGNAASQTNLPLLLIVLSMATFAFVGPLVALRLNIVAEKNTELDGLRESIRLTRNRPGGVLANPQLANTVAYYQLIEGAREWPIDAANLLRFLGYLLLGLGSWLGGAVVERMLDTAFRA